MSDTITTSTATAERVATVESALCQAESTLQKTRREADSMREQLQQALKAAATAQESAAAEKAEADERISQLDNMMDKVGHLKMGEGTRKSRVLGSCFSSPSRCSGIFAV